MGGSYLEATINTRIIIYLHLRALAKHMLKATQDKSISRKQLEKYNRHNFKHTLLLQLCLGASTLGRIRVLISNPPQLIIVN